MTYKRGDFWRIDDNSGFKVRSSRTAKQWGGFITTDPDIRNPQDFVRGRKDYQNVPEPRPEVSGVFIGPTAALLTEAESNILTEDGMYIQLEILDAVEQEDTSLLSEAGLSFTSELGFIIRTE